jgi:environmental stress-induced protein Ves
MTREISVRTPADSRRTPWKNGRGVTEELAIWPRGSSLDRMDFDWRISKSRVEEDGAFSAFPGFERTLVVTEGGGLVLSHGEDAPRSGLRPREPYRFDGAWMTHAQLVAGPIADFNVIARRSAVHVNVQVTRLGSRRARDEVGPDHAFVHVLSGAVTVRVPREESPFELQSGDSLWAEDLGVFEEFECAGTGPETCLILVRIEKPR